MAFKIHAYVPSEISPGLSSEVYMGMLSRLFFEFQEALLVKTQNEFLNELLLLLKFLKESQ